MKNIHTSSLKTLNEATDLSGEEIVAESTLQEVDHIDTSHYRGSLTNLYISQIKEFKLLTREEEIALTQAKKDGDQSAREKLINHNLRLVVALAKKKYDQLYASGVSGVNFDDLIQDGSTGLITAVDRYDSDYGVKFSTYAVYWINQAIDQGLAATTRAVKIPEHKISEIVAVKHTISNLELGLGRVPFPGEIYLVLNKKFSQEQVNDLLRLMRNDGTVSLDTPVGDEQDGTVGDMIADDNSVSPSQYAEKMDRHERLYAALNQLPDREKMIMVHSFGLNDCEPLTLSELSQLLFQSGYTNKQGNPISPEGIRLIKDKTLKKMATLLQE